ncbi:MAG: sugar phosphate isomerase/epimerase family protein [Halolamina sp.]
MQYGNSLGPFLDRIPDLPDGFEFAEPSLGEANVPLREVDPDRIRERCAAAGLGVIVHLPIEQPLVQAPPEHADGVHAHFDRALSLAAEMGAEKAVAHCTANRGSRGDVDLFRENVRRLDAAGAEHGVEVTFENLGHLDRGYSLDTVGEVLADCGAAVCFDVGHAYMEGGQDAVEEFLADHAGRVSHLHAHDARHRGDSHLTLGDGEIDYGPVASELVAAGFDGTVTVESFTPDTRLVEHSLCVLQEAFENAR